MTSLPPAPVPFDTAAVTTVAEAAAAMTAINTWLAPSDGVAAFNRMYLAVTEAVAAAITGTVFADAEFLARLDVLFAERYLRAVTASFSGEPAPACWAVLWSARESPHRSELQFALAGMNAHINHDLVLTVVDTLEAAGRTFHDHGLHADFRRVNEVLARLEPEIRRGFVHRRGPGGASRLDEVKDHVDLWSITRAREIAWRDAELLWRVRHQPAARARFERALDDTVAAAGRLLLLPLEHAGRHADERTTPPGGAAVRSWTEGA